MMEDDSNKTWGVYGSVLILFSHFGFFASEPYYHRFIVVYLVSYCRTQGGMFFFFLKFLGHHEEEKKKIVTVLLLKKIIFIFIFLGSPWGRKEKISHRIAFDTIFIKKKPEKKGKKSLKSQLSKSFHVGMGWEGGGSGCCKIIPYTFSSLVFVQKIGMRSFTSPPPQAYLHRTRGGPLARKHPMLDGRYCLRGRKLGPMFSISLIRKLGSAITETKNSFFKKNKNLNFIIIIVIVVVLIYKSRLWNWYNN